MANIESDRVFQTQLEGRNGPLPIEIAVYARQSWLWKECPLQGLPQEWKMWASWRANRESMIDWFKSISSNQREIYTPWFKNYCQCEYLKELWTGWIHNGDCLCYKTLPVGDKIFDDARVIRAEQLLRNDYEFADDEFPFLGGLKPTEDRWFLIALGAALRAEPKADSRGRKWLRSLCENPASAIAWFASLSEYDRQTTTRALVSKDVKCPPDTSRVIFYRDGRIREEVLRDDDELVAKGDKNQISFVTSLLGSDRCLDGEYLSRCAREWGMSVEDAQEQLGL